MSFLEYIGFMSVLENMKLGIYFVFRLNPLFLVPAFILGVYIFIYEIILFQASRRDVLNSYQDPKNMWLLLYERVRDREVPALLFCFCFVAVILLLLAALFTTVS